jgi:hypothetical protein
LFSLPPGTEMFQFPGFPVPALCIQTGLTGHDPSRVSPFGDPWIDGWLTPPQGLSQSPTSFIGSRCQGIHRVLLSTCRRDARARYPVLKDRPTTRPGQPTPRGWRYQTRQQTRESNSQSCTRCEHPHRGDTRNRHTTHTPHTPKGTRRAQAPGTESHGPTRTQRKPAVHETHPNLRHERSQHPDTCAPERR